MQIKTHGSESQGQEEAICMPIFRHIGTFFYLATCLIYEYTTKYIYVHLMYLSPCNYPLQLVYRFTGLPLLHNNLLRIISGITK